MDTGKLLMLTAAWLLVTVLPAQAQTTGAQTTQPPATTEEMGSGSGLFQTTYPMTTTDSATTMDLLMPGGSGMGSGDLLTPSQSTTAPSTPALTTAPTELTPFIQLSFVASQQEFETSIGPVLALVIMNATNTAGNFTVEINEELSSNTSVVAIVFIEPTDTTQSASDLTAAAYTALLSDNNAEWARLRDLYEAMISLMGVEPTSVTTSATPVIRLTLWQWLILAVGNTFLLLVVLLLLSYCCHVLASRRGRKNHYKKGYQHKQLDKRFLLSRTPLTKPEDVEMNPPRKLARITLRPKGMLQQLAHPLTIPELEPLVDNTAALHQEYSSIPSNMVSMTEVPPGAEDKNRYRDVLPNPYTRVALFLKFGVANSDYINANFIRGYKDSSKCYIATQGPLQWTVADFWRMVWEQRVTTIVMVTGLEERGVHKCSRYWPDETINHSTNYEDLEVRLKRRLSASNKQYVTTTFHLAHKQKMVSREVTHFWFTGWPDHGVPGTAKPLVEFLLHVRGHVREMPGPTVVHCSAGIGRSGVYIGADVGMTQLEEEGQVDILKIVSTLRQDRGGMVQTRDQYVFLYQVMLEYGHYLSQVRSLYRKGGFKSQPQPTIEEESSDTLALLTN